MLFHKKVFMPEDIASIKRIVFTPVYTQHAKDEANSDIYGLIELPAKIAFTGKDVFEAEYINGAYTKLVVRIAYDDTLDITIAFIPATLSVKTVWFNDKNDLHFTLDTRKYTGKRDYEYHKNN
jgi:hypothetical protein